MPPNWPASAIKGAHAKYAPQPGQRLTPRAQAPIDSLVLPTDREGQSRALTLNKMGRSPRCKGKAKARALKHLTEPGLLYLKKPKSGKEMGRNENEKKSQPITHTTKNNPGRVTHRKQPFVHRLLPQASFPTSPLHLSHQLHLRCEKSSEAPSPGTIRSNGIQNQGGGMEQKPLRDKLSNCHRAFEKSDQ